MNPDRFKTPKTASNPPAESAPDVDTAPVPAPPSAPILEPHFSESQPASAQVIPEGELDPVTQAILDEIPDRPRKPQKDEPGVEDQPAEEAEGAARPGLAKGLPTGALFGAAALALGVLVLRSLGGSQAAPLPAAPPVAPPAAPHGRMGTVVQ